MDDALRSRALSRPRFGFGVITAALVALVSGGTGLLVSQGARQLQPPPTQAVAPPAPSAPSAPVVVRRAPGSVALPRVIGPAVLVPVAPVGPPSGPAAEPPLAPPVVAPPVLPPVAEPPVAPPVVEPPVTPPVAEPPVAEPEERPGRESRKAEARRGGPHDHDAGKGKGDGKKGKGKKKDKQHAAGRDDHRGQHRE